MSEKKTVLRPGFVDAGDVPDVSSGPPAPAAKPPTEKLRPGFASEEPRDEEEPKLEGKLGVAHYAGMTEKEAAEAWAKETLCSTCLCQGVCRVAAAAQDSLVLVSRCLSYLPGAG